MFNMIHKKTNSAGTDQLTNYTCIMSQNSLPSAWANSKRKLSSIDGMGISSPKRARSDKCGAGLIEDVMTDHMRCNCLTEVPTQSAFDTETLLETVPFCKMLATMATNTSVHDVPIMSRVYEERFMRECTSALEKRCIMDKQCECMLIDSSKPFVGVQFCIPNVHDDTNGLCVLCLRKITTLLFFQTIHKGIPVQTRIQRHGNICNDENEYHPSVMLVCPPNGPVESMPVPIVAHQRNRYEVVVVLGVHYLKQKKVGMQDFR